MAFTVGFSHTSRQLLNSLYCTSGLGVCKNNKSHIGMFVMEFSISVFGPELLLL
jgi:hypothetical protein